MDWIEHDEVSRDSLPDWAREARSAPLDGGRYDVHLEAAGVVLVSRDDGAARCAALPWSLILVLVLMPRESPRHLLLAVPRRPPSPPWFELTGAHVEETAAAIDARLAALRDGGYRDEPLRRETMSPEEVYAAVLARRPVPGEVVIPAAETTGYPLAAGALVGGALGALAFPFGWAAAVGVGMLSAASGAALAMRWRARRGPWRVLVLTPDAFVGGLDGQAVRAVPWSWVDAFEAGTDAVNEAALVVLGSDRRPLARVNARFFGAPLEVIVSVAEAYRARAQAL